jgi:hypothetical protein
MGEVAQSKAEIKTNIVNLLHYNMHDYKDSVDKNLKNSRDSSNKIYHLIKSSINKK